MTGAAKKKILVTGASGSLGKQIIYELSKYDCFTPIAQVRQTSDTTFLDRLGVEKRIADIRHEQELSGLVEGINVVIHTAAWVNFRQDQLPLFTQINVTGAVNMYRAACSSGVSRFIHVSTIAAVAAIPRSQNKKNSLFTFSLIQEDAPFNLHHLRIPYIITKRAAEEELLKISADQKTELVIVNPSIIVAPSRTGDDRNKAEKKFPRFLVPDLPFHVNLVDIRDVARGIVAATEKGRNRERYLLTGENISGRDLILVVSAILEKAPHLVKVPRVLLNALARASVFYGKIFKNGKVSFYPDIVKLTDYDWVYSSAKARQELGYYTRSIYTTLTELLTNNFTDSYAKPVLKSSAEASEKNP